jgi:hypothetical protein
VDKPLAASLWEAIQKQALPKVEADLTIEVEDCSLSYSYGSEEGIHVDIQTHAYLETIETLDVLWVDDDDDIPWAEVEVSEIEPYPDAPKRLILSVTWRVIYYEASRGDEEGDVWQCRATLKPIVEVA